MAPKKSDIRLIVLSAFYLLYIVIGASIFSAIEGPEERALINKLRKTRMLFKRSADCVTDAELEAFIVEVIEANNRGVSAVRNVTTTEPNWSFGQAMFFAGTILTTIGYGHVTPLSEGGKIFCMVYATIGIPLTMIMLTAIVERMMVLTSKLLSYLTEKLGHLYKQIHIRLIHLSIVLGILVIFMFLVPAGIFSALEPNWNYLDAFYCCFISLTTIGLGDYIPGDSPNQSHRPLYKIFTTFYLFIGLAMMMLTLANIYDVPELNVGYHFYMRNEDEDAEKTKLRSSKQGPKYTEQNNEAFQPEPVSKLDERANLTDE